MYSLKDNLNKLDLSGKNYDSSVYGEGRAILRKPSWSLC